MLTFIEYFLKARNGVKGFTHVSSFHLHKSPVGKNPFHCSHFRNEKVMCRKITNLSKVTWRVRKLTFEPKQ